MTANEQGLLSVIEFKKQMTMILTEDEIMKKSSDYSEAHSKDLLQRTCLQQGYADGWADCQQLLQQTPCTTLLPGCQAHYFVQ